MPHIIVTAGEPSHEGDRLVMLRERVTCSDFESEHFARQLIERLGWAVEDAHEREQECVREDAAAPTREPELQGVSS